MLSSRRLVFIKYYCEKNMWFFKICWRVNCFMKITRSKGVLSSEFNSSTLMNGSSSNWSFILSNSMMLSPDDSMLFKNWLILCFNVSVFYLCCCQTYSVIELRFGVTIFYPRSFSKIINTFFSWGTIVLLLIDSYTLSHWII